MSVQLNTYDLSPRISTAMAAVSTAASSRPGPALGMSASMVAIDSCFRRSPSADDGNGVRLTILSATPPAGTSAGGRKGGPHQCDVEPRLDGHGVCAQRQPP